MVAFTVLLLLQVPPPEELYVRVLFTHTLNVPVMSAGDTFTVISRDLEQPVASVYSIVVLPAPAPAVTSPVLELIDAIPGSLLVQTPPDGVDTCAAVPFTQTVDGPVIAVGKAFTVTC